MRTGWSNGSGLPELININVTKVGIQLPTAKFDWLLKKKKNADNNKYCLIALL